jgi:hypothetical protein
MTNSTRIRITAVATALFLGALSAAGLVARGTQGPDAPATAAAAFSQPDEESTASSAEPVVDATYSAEGEDGQYEGLEDDGYESSEEDDD